MSQNDRKLNSLKLGVLSFLVCKLSGHVVHQQQENKGILDIPLLSGKLSRHFKKKTRVVKTTGPLFKKKILSFGMCSHSFSGNLSGHAASLWSAVRREGFKEGQEEHRVLHVETCMQPLLARSSAIHEIHWNTISCAAAAVGRQAAWNPCQLPTTTLFNDASGNLAPSCGGFRQLSACYGAVFVRLPFELKRGRWF